MKREGKVLAVDSNKEVLHWIEKLLNPYIKELHTASTPCQVPKIINDNSFDVILLSMEFKNYSEDNALGIKVLHHILKCDPNAQVIFMVAKGDVNSVIEVIKAGATDAVEGTCEGEDLVKKVMAVIHQNEVNRQVETVDISTLKQHEFVYRSDAMNKVVEIIEKVAPSEANVLILGENGTGKELVAQSIHRQSLRKDKLFVSVDMGALNESLFENELFGHAKGAYTDAKTSMPGRFELANGGTVFLDEIGNLSMPMQSKLLTVLEKREVSRIGENDARSIDIRLVCATNKSLHTMVKEETFRRDLLYRMNTVEIVLPPLRERREDIPVLVAYFLKRYCAMYQKALLKIDKMAINCMYDYQWPGNIRELQHVIEKAVILAEGNKLTRKELCQRGDPDTERQLAFKSYNLEDVERQVINKVLRMNSGNLTHSASTLGITRASLYRRLRKYEL